LAAFTSASALDLAILASVSLIFALAFWLINLFFCSNIAFELWNCSILLLLKL
jgi:hypothetical protein